MYQSGDVLLVPFPFSNMKEGKKRPVLALTAPDAFNDLVCLAITSSSYHEESFPLDNNCFLEGVLPKPSWVRTDKIYTLNVSLIVGKFGLLHQEVFSEVKKQFCNHFGCDLFNRDYHER